MIRIIHRGATDSPEQLLADVASLRQREGIKEAEAYQTLAVEDEDCAVAILAEQVADYAAVVEKLPELPHLHQFVQDGATELYEQSAYALVDGVWAPEAGSDSRIMWPASGPVSIVIQNAFVDNPEMRALTAQEITETRREPGCCYYAWMENLELPNHLMLLEVWADQTIYDHHWFGRMATGEYRGDSGRTATTPQRGALTREFYRQQSFEYHYGRLLPAATENYSHSVVWSAR
ncbi:putative quinol monooxygenase [Corynebacterium sp. p3-SID1056]|uniref:putative quinol monooxygenase n=1 Tax=Corynebacterium sp. p3-SID1056 TaxID=2916092 RepID=UPI0021A4B218|nr:antibiotic biosynthesis monooxygenase [Corynebacterium sp. p3-SID1056]MCT2338266.1 antibiotic biosynthesis monooxygenase [Corynebacterium sp. p3-SID1056]